MTRIATGLARDAAEAAADAAAALGDLRADLACVFLSADQAPVAEEAVSAVHEELDPRHLIGCVADGVVAGDAEIEDGTASAVWAASLPGAEIDSFQLTTAEADAGLVVAGLPPTGGADLVALIVDPYTFPADAFLEQLNEDQPGVPLVGGIASGRRLVLGDETLPGGAVGAVVRGAAVRTLVSQGCAPVGREAVVTAAEANLVYELAGERAIDRLRDEIMALGERERALAAGGLLVGLVIDENKPEYERGDYLMRALLGADEESGALAVGAPVRVGQTIRFQVRDAASADEDLGRRSPR